MEDEKSINAEQSVKVKPRKFGGWIYLIAIGIFIGPLINLNNLFSYHLKSIYNGTWSNLTSISSTLYHPIYLPTLILELFVTITLLIIGFLQIYLFIKKDKRFPEVYSLALLFSAISSLLVLICIRLYPNPEPEVLKSLTKTTSQNIIQAIIWITYMFKSIRIKETFIQQTNSFTFLNLHRTFILPFLFVFLIFTWAFLNRNSIPNTGRTNKNIENSDSTITKLVDKELDSKEIADLALSNLLVIEPINQKGKIFGVGSGFFILPNIVATNAHVVDGAHAIRLRRPNSKITDMVLEIISVDNTADIALLRTTNFISEKPLKLGNTDNVSIGTNIYTVGNPQGLEGTFTDGLVSNKQRARGIDFVQISAPISSGSSGGPVLDSHGNVIGVTTAYIKRGQNLNIAVPSVYISRLIMRTEAFYPLSKNHELMSNISIQNLFPQVCSYLIDIDLPAKYFSEISEKDLQSKEMKAVCEQSMPTCKRAWVNRLTDGIVFVGSYELPSTDVEKLSRDQFEKQTLSIVDKIKKAYRQGIDSNTTFKVSTKDLNQHTHILDIESHYSTSGIDYTDYRSMYFILPYCRLDVLYSSSRKNAQLDGTVYNILTNNFAKVLPGSSAEKVLFKFGK